MKRLWRFIKEYKLLSLAVLTIIVGLYLQITGQHTAVRIVLETVAIIEVIPELWEMWQDFRSGSYGLDILAATAVIASVILNQPWAAIVIVLMLIGGESLEDYAQHRAKSELRALLKQAPVKAHVIRKGKESEVKVSDLHIGERIIIRAGEVVPVDASIIDGTANFDEASLTGESLPKVKKVQDQISSGSINLDGVITAKVIASAEDSQYQQIIKLVRSAAASKAPFVRLAARYSLPFTFAAYAIGVTAWLISGQSIRFLEVIVVATPCPLLLAVPTALISGVSRASRYGIIIKTGAALERLADAQTIAFDKTGTLTQGKLHVNSIKTYQSFTKEEVLGFAASLEQNSNHILARTIVDAATTQHIKLIKTKHVQEIAGLGIQATVKGKHVIVGRLGLLREQGITLPAKLKVTDIDQTAVYVAIDGIFAGFITLEDILRPESKATLETLRRLGLRNTVLMTGDNEVAAHKIGRALGIKHIHADMMPADKLHILDEVPARPLAFVGDGVNDAPILTASDVGIALGASGQTAASESADIVIMSENIAKVANAYEISKRTIKIATQSIIVGLGISLVLMIIFATGKFTPVTGALLQEVVDIIVIFNALRAHSGKLIAVHD